MSLRPHSRSTLELDELDAPLVLCRADGELLASTPSARQLLARMGSRSARLPDALWNELTAFPNGYAVEWRPDTAVRSVFGCTRYAAGAGAFLVIVKEVSQRQKAVSRRLHRQRLEAIGGLVASVAHELRNSIASIVYNADVVSLGPEQCPVRDEALDEIVSVSKRLRRTVDGLLDFAKLGPSVSIPVSLEDVFTRAQAVLRSLYREGEHRMLLEIGPGARWVQGNTLVIEQIFVNLLLNAAQSVPAGSHVTARVSASLQEPDRAGEGRVRVEVRDDGPGISAVLREQIFEAFVTTRSEGTGIGLTNAREAAEALGGSLDLDPADGGGACFVVCLPLADPRSSALQADTSSRPSRRTLPSVCSSCHPEEDRP